MFSLSIDETILLDKILTFAIDKGFKQELSLRNTNIINCIERKLLAYKVPEKIIKVKESNLLYNRRRTDRVLT